MTVATETMGAKHVESRLRKLARSVAEPNGFWKTMALGMAALVVAMLGWFLIDQAQQSRQFRQETRTTLQLIERRLNRIETRNGFDDGRPAP